MTSTSWVEAAILDAATPSLYANNAFKSLGLSVTASPREIKRQAEKIELRRKISKMKSGPGTLRPLVPEMQAKGSASYSPSDGQSPDKYTIRQAVQRLGEPQTRLVDELFWFWPLDPSWEGEDPALDSVLVGDYQGAASIWKKAEDSGIRSAIANHNLAVLHHRTALDYVLVSEGLQLSNQSRQDLEFQWREANHRWEQLVQQDGFWREVAARIRDLEDPRLTSTAADEVRRTLPTALLLLAARLLIAAAENGQIFEVPRYSSLLHGSPFDIEHRETALRIAVAPIRERISVACSSAEERTAIDPVKADDTVGGLLDGGGVSSELAIVDSMLPEGHPTRVGIHDQAALQLLRCVRQFSNRTEDYERELELLHELRKISESDSAIRSIDEEIETARENAGRDLRWYGPGYHDAPPKLFDELESARSQFELQNWEAAIAVLRSSLRSWRGDPASSLINKPLAFCLYVSAFASFSQAIRSNTPVWGRASHGQVQAVQAAIRRAAKNLAEAIALDPGNKDIAEGYDQIRGYASQARVRIAPLPPAAKRSLSRAGASGTGGAPPVPAGYGQPTTNPGARDIVIALAIIGALLLAIGIVSGQSPRPTSSRSSSSSINSSSAVIVRTPTPTRTRVPTRFPTRTPSEPDCLAWDEVGVNRRGRYTCVYGRVVAVYEDAPYAQFILFSKQSGTFLVRGEDYFFKEVSVMQCVRVEGTIYQSTSYLYMDIDNPSTRLGPAPSGMCNS